MRSFKASMSNRLAILRIGSLLRCQTHFDHFKGCDAFVHNFVDSAFRFWCVTFILQELAVGLPAKGFDSLNCFFAIYLFVSAFFAASCTII
eukprot:m.128120 g.128120  ORF g.128120 m.128120 type:complete len:91 (+) comp13864_c0_seq2:176-448(+)